jgi:uncharacterized damage-inducible protein DinB
MVYFDAKFKILDFRSNEKILINNNELIIMLEFIQKSLVKGLKGAYSHINPLEAILDSDASIARTKVEGVNHSIWEILHHIVVWQEIFIENIKGNNPDWENPGDWLTEESMQNDDDFSKLLQRYRGGFKELENLITTVDMSSTSPYWKDDPILQFIVVAITHNSYHIGQIMAIKRGLIKA